MQGCFFDELDRKLIKERYPRRNEVTRNKWQLYLPGGQSWCVHHKNNVSTYTDTPKQITNWPKRTQTRAHKETFKIVTTCYNSKTSKNTCEFCAKTPMSPPPRSWYCFPAFHSPNHCSSLGVVPSWCLPSSCWAMQLYAMPNCQLGKNFDLKCSAMHNMHWGLQVNQTNAIRTKSFDRKAYFWNNHHGIWPVWEVRAFQNRPV